jgi:hypothetical protein
LLSKNKHDESVQNSITLLKLSRLIENDPILVNYLTNGCVARSIAILSSNEALQSGHVSNEYRQKLENELAKINLRLAYLQALKAERVFSLTYFEEMKNTMPGFYSAMFLNREIHGCLDVLEWMIAQAEAKLPENASKPLPNISPTPPSSGPLGSQLLPSLQAAEKSADRVDAEIRVLRVINALGRRDEPDKMPLADLSDLGLPKSTITDPFSDSGKPLIVKKVDGGWLVYSVGENKVDDGGNVDDSQGAPLDIGLRPVIRTRPDAGEPKSK